MSKFNNFNSTYEEQIKHTPKNNHNRGNWSDKRGNSKFIPTANQKRLFLS